jgi:hypothetical protein
MVVGRLMFFWAGVEYLLFQRLVNGGWLVDVGLVQSTCCFKGVVVGWLMLGCAEHLLFQRLMDGDWLVVLGWCGVLAFQWLVDVGWLVGVWLV